MADEVDQMEELVLTLYAILDSLVEELGALPSADLSMSDFEIDDSALLHADEKRKYDPKKAHDYYMRTRKLKGRQGPTAPSGYPAAPFTSNQLRLKYSNTPHAIAAKSAFKVARNMTNVAGNTAENAAQVAQIPPKFVIKVFRRNLRAIYHVVKAAGKEAVDATGIEESLRNLEKETR